MSGKKVSEIQIRLTYCKGPSVRDFFSASRGLRERGEWDEGDHNDYDGSRERCTVPYQLINEDGSDRSVCGQHLLVGRYQKKGVQEI